MSNKLDDLFKDKLEGHQTSPRPEAWNIMKGTLESDKRKGYLYLWKVAAMIVLVTGAVFAFYLIQPDQNLAVIDTKNQIPPSTNQVDEKVSDNDVAIEESKNETVKQITSLSKDKQETQYISSVQKKVSKAQNEENEKVIQHQKKGDNQINTAPNATMIAQNVSGIQPIDSSSNMVKVDALTPNETTHDIENKSDEKMIASLDLKNNTLNEVEYESSNVVITFIKNQDKKEEIIEVDKKKKFGLKTVIALASEIKKGERGIAELRKKKDDLLAFGFNKEKSVKNSNK